jgi:hypothetical protein
MMTIYPFTPYHTGTGHALHPFYRALLACQNMTIGAAIKTVEYMPETIPIKSANEKSRRTAPPKKNMDATAMSVVKVVRTVLDKVWFTLIFMISFNEALR